ncbi:uncharacterized protein [Asterias amurensis]|uniref:uncharacterized protein n=1 Tax=Asterias amurensis TaxID=7602 RepID=UPI003AB2AD68
MPNSGYQGLINQHYYGDTKEAVFPPGEKYGQSNLPNPAFWHAYITGGQPARRSGGMRGGSKYSRHLNMSDPLAGVGASSSPVNSMMWPNLRGPSPTSEIPYESPQPLTHCLQEGGIKTNSVAPFATLAKPTCGFFFSRVTDNKKRRTGIPPADLVKWRYIK